MATHEQQDERVVLLDVVLDSRDRPRRSAAPTSSRAGGGDLAADVIVMRASATWISQPRGLSGTPSRGHCVAAAISASCTASSAAAKSPYGRIVAPSTCGVEIAQQLLGRGRVWTICRRS
jgi:hypothetical protein